MTPVPGSRLRRIASAIVPTSGKRRIDAVRNRRTMAAIAPVNREFVRRHGLEVSGGPFAGMRYLAGLEDSQGDLVGKLLGRYESEIDGAVRGWRNAQPPLSLVLNVGCAEGYYAVGFAVTMPGTRVIAYDIDPAARELCASLAALNDVSDRVEIRGECTPHVLNGLPTSGVGLFCDCEGYELALLDPAAAPVLRNWSIIVELHDFVDPTITDTIRARFQGTHEVEVIRSTPPGPAPAELEFMSPRQLELVLNERPVPMNWARLTPRG